MSIQGRMMAVPASVAEGLRDSPEVIEDFLTVVGPGMDDLAGGGPVEVLDGMIRGARGVGCLWRMVPSFLRHAVLRRVLPRELGTPGPIELPSPEQFRQMMLDQPHVQEMSDAEREAFLAEGMTRLEEARAAQATAPAPEHDDSTADLPTLDLHKDWHLLHFALTGSADAGEGPAFDAILGGEEVGEDLGYGPARLLGPAEVARVAAHLEGLDPAAVVKALDVGAAQAVDVYGADAARDREVRRGLVDRLRALRDHYVAAADRGDSMLLWMD